QTIKAVTEDANLMVEAFHELVFQQSSLTNWLPKRLLKHGNRCTRKTVSFSHIWKIEKFSYLCDDTFKKRYPTIYSCNFGASPDDPLQFHLEMHTRGVNMWSRKYCSLFLNLATSKNSKEIVLFQFSILDS